MNIRVQNISKNFERFPALNDVSVEVRQGDLLALLGPSGSGKTTLLRIIAGLEFPHPNDGKVLFDDKDVTWSSAYERRAGFVFQHYALFNHLTVAENIAFGLRVRPRKTRPPESEIQKRITVLLEMVQLPGLEKRFPAQLSGGQRQRIALARALAVEPKILLLDEPFGALDAKVRKDLRKWLRKFHDQTGLTTIFVTHDQEEAFELADHVTILHQGKIQQSGTPKEILARPANAF
ncbi:MAG: ATP-binding cassette domain-containing protein, partial [Verrucomicrobia bacterium]|nr:ATP-binding cassette domain-containing protein [Verrucomicrobiota bacterium]